MISIHCPYCDKHTALSVAETTYRSQYGGTSYTQAVYKTNEGRNWWMGVCNGCQGVVLVRDQGAFIAPAPLPSPTDKRIPDEIRSDVMEAKKCFSAECYRAAATMARRAIQQACLNKGASGNTLVAQIKDLTSKGQITKDLQDWATVIRWVGNDGAHPDSPLVTEEEARDSIELVEQFMHVVYVAPAIALARRNARKNQS
jgi:hypothetical protein